LSSRRSWGLPLAVFAAVLTVRLVYAASLQHDPLSRWPSWTETDEHGTLVWAGRLAAGNWLDEPPYRHYASWQRRFGTEEQWNSWYPPHAYYQGALYPYLVALARLASGSPVLPVRLAQHLLAAAAAAALAAAARNVAGRRDPGRAAVAAGAVAGLAVGLYAPALFHDGFIQRDGPLLSLSTLLLAAPFLRPPRGAAGAAATGLLGGLTALLKQTSLPLAVASLWAVVRAADGTARRRALAIGALALALPLAILAGRNLAVGASPLAYDTRQVVGFAGYLAYGADATVVPSPLTGTILEAAKGSTGRAALLALRSHRGHLAGLLPLAGNRVAAFFHAFEVPDNANFYLFRRRLFPLRYLPVYGCLLGPGLVGLFLGARRLLTRDETLVALAALLVPFVSSVLPAITSRYRLGVAAPLALGAGLLVAFLLSDRVSARRKGAACALALVLSAVTLLPAVIPASRERGVDEQVLQMLSDGRL
jgi:hypothetical protein